MNLFPKYVCPEPRFHESVDDGCFREDSKHGHWLCICEVPIVHYRPAHCLLKTAHILLMVYLSFRSLPHRRQAWLINKFRRLWGHLVSVGVGWMNWLCPKVGVSVGVGVGEPTISGTSHVHAE